MLGLFMGVGLFHLGDSTVESLCSEDLGNLLTYNCVCTRSHHPSRRERANLEGKSKNWRLMIGSPMFFPLIVCALIYFSPESPR